MTEIFQQKPGVLTRPENDETKFEDLKLRPFIAISTTIEYKIIFSMFRSHCKSLQQILDN